MTGLVLTGLDGKLLVYGNESIDYQLTGCDYVHGL